MFCTAINCMDGRVQLPVISFMQKRFERLHVDMITEPGPNKILADQTDTATINAIRKRIDISVKRHHSRGIAIVGHEDCGGNPAEKPEQLEQLRSARTYLRERYPECDTIALWVDLVGNVEVLDE